MSPKKELEKHTSNREERERRDRDSLNPSATVPSEIPTGLHCFPAMARQSGWLREV